MATNPYPTARRVEPTPESGRRALERAVVATLAYADVFGHALTATEVHRHLIAVRATPTQVRAALAQVGGLSRGNGYYALPGRQAVVATRLRRAATAARLWPRALRWGRALAALPFVRMVAVTGALAVDCVEQGADVDFLIVAATGRVWVCRALVVALARVVSLRGAALCPNYLLSEDALEIPVRSLYTAHELVQMVLIAGRPTFLKMIHANPWVAEFLPNANAAHTVPDDARLVGGALTRLAETPLCGKFGDLLESRLRLWQSARLRRKIEAGQLGGREASFGADGYKGHFDAHGEQIMASWEARLHELRGPLA